jgi:hypothetical protein
MNRDDYRIRRQRPADMWPEPWWRRAIARVVAWVRSIG